MHADTRHNPASAPTATQAVEWVGVGGCLTLHDSPRASQPVSVPPRLFVALGCGGVSWCHRLRINTCFVFSAVLNSEQAAGLRPKKHEKWTNPKHAEQINFFVHFHAWSLRPSLDFEMSVDETAEQARHLAADCRWSSFREEASSY